MIQGALERLAAAGIPFALRGEQPIDDPAPDRRVHILLGVDRLDAARGALEQVGFYYEATAESRCFLAFDRQRGQWQRIDVTVVPERLGWDLSARDEVSLRRFDAYGMGEKANPGVVECIRPAFSWRRPPGPRRPGPVLAVLGPDGAGKGSVIAALKQQIPMPVTPIYLGLGGLSGADYRSVRAGPEPALRARGRAALTAVRGGLRRASYAVLPEHLVVSQYRVRQALRLAAMVVPAYMHAWRGHMVICDRYPLEQVAVTQPASRGVLAFERMVFRYLVPWPDVVVILDAPAEVMFARKGEHSVPVLQAWRARYREIFEPLGARVVSTDQPLEQSVAEVSELAWNALRARRGW